MLLQMPRAPSTTYAVLVRSPAAKSKTHRDPGPNTIVGRTGTLLMQGAEFLAGADVAQAPGRDARFEGK